MRPPPSSPCPLAPSSLRWSPPTQRKPPAPGPRRKASAMAAAAAARRGCLVALLAVLFLACAAEGGAAAASAAQQLRRRRHLLRRQRQVHSHLRRLNKAPLASIEVAARLLLSSPPHQHGAHSMHAASLAIDFPFRFFFLFLLWSLAGMEGRKE